MQEGLNRGEEEALREQLREGTSPECPRCEKLLRLVSVPPRSDVSYVRDRVLLICDSCGLKAVLDKK